MIRNMISVMRRLYRERFTAAATQKKKSRAFENKQILKQLKGDGIAVIPNFFSREFCDSVVQSMDLYIAARKNEFLVVKEQVKDSKNYKFGVPQHDGTSFWVDKVESDIRIIGAEKMSALIAQEFHHNEFLLEAGEALLKRPLQKNFTMANRTSFVVDNPGSGGGWHRDNNYAHGFKALVYLTDVHENNGPFEYIKKSFSLKNHLLEFPYPDKYQFTTEEIEAFIKKNPGLHQKNMGDAGTLVLFNTNSIHRGTPLKSGVRYALTNYYK